MQNSMIFFVDKMWEELILGDHDIFISIQALLGHLECDPCTTGLHTAASPATVSGKRVTC